MATHSLTFNLTTDQVVALSCALDEHYQANIDALEDGCHSDDALANFRKQCQALDVLINSIGKIVEPSNAQ